MGGMTAAEERSHAQLLEAPIGYGRTYLPVEVVDEHPEGFQPGWVFVRDLTRESGYSTLAVRADLLRERRSV